MLEFSSEVRDALDRGAAVVALESTIIAHGLPYPDNLAIARALEDTVREVGAVPATIAVLAGVPRIGLDDAGLESLARAREAGERPIVKTGAGDLAFQMASRADAATTVSATAFLASRAGIRVFATGGIGGVHRGDSGDVSSDLTMLGQVPIAVVSAGAKAILDLARTLEVLETLGVLVVGYGTDELPAFYTRESGLALEHRIDDPESMARLLRVRFDELDQKGVLIANPIPVHGAMERSAIDRAIEQACDDAEREGISGKHLTPFLLARLAEVTDGASVAANRILAIHNARVAAQIAVAYAQR